jgi:hypothetical protein
LQTNITSDANAKVIGLNEKMISAIARLFLPFMSSTTCRLQIDSNSSRKEAERVSAAGMYTMDAHYAEACKLALR